MYIFPVGDPWFDLLLGEYVIKIEIFQRILLKLISFISKLFYTFMTRSSMLGATCLYILKFLLHWFRDSFGKAGNSKFELCSNLQCSMVRLSYLKKRSRIILYSHQNYDFKKRNPEVYILRHKVRVKFSAISSTFRALHLWFWTAGRELRIISRFTANILVKLHASRKMLQTCAKKNSKNSVNRIIKKFIKKFIKQENNLCI